MLEHEHVITFIIYKIRTCSTTLIAIEIINIVCDEIIVNTQW